MTCELNRTTIRAIVVLDAKAQIDRSILSDCFPREFKELESEILLWDRGEEADHDEEDEL